MSSIRNIPLFLTGALLFIASAGPGACLNGEGVHTTAAETPDSGSAVAITMAAGMRRLPLTTPRNHDLPTTSTRPHRPRPGAPSPRRLNSA